MLKAANWVTERRERLLADRAGIAFETVFSTPDKVDFLTRAVAAGYFVRVFFVGTNDPSLNAARVAQRVMAGGHSVPIEKIISRYSKSMTNLAAAIAIADRVYIYDNSLEGQAARLCARTRDGALDKVCGDLPAWVEDALRGLPDRA